jgi:hypothetical protein
MDGRQLSRNTTQLERERAASRSPRLRRAASLPDQMSKEHSSDSSVDAWMRLGKTIHDFFRIRAGGASTRVGCRPTVIPTQQLWLHPAQHAVRGDQPKRRTPVFQYIDRRCVHNIQVKIARYGIGLTTTILEVDRFVSTSACFAWLVD